MNQRRMFAQGGRAAARRRRPQHGALQWLSVVVLAMLLVGCGGATATDTPAVSGGAPATGTPAASSGTTAATDTPAGAANTVAPAASTDTPASGMTPTGGAAAGTSGAAAAVATATPFPPVPQPAGSLKITFWYGLTGFNGTIVQQLVNKFNTSQSKYYIDAIQQPDYDSTIRKLNTSLAGGALPNLVQIYDIGTQRMIDTHRIVPAQDFIDKEHLTDLVGDIEPAVASYYTVNGKLYSMPFNSSAPVLYYNKTAFKEVGLDPDHPPLTYDDLFAAAQKLVKKDANGKIIRSGIDFTLYGWIFEQELATQGALYAEPADGRNGRATKLVFNNQAGVNWLNLLKKLVDAGVGRSVGRASGTTNGTTLGANFSRGDAAMALESIATLRGWSSQAAKAGNKVDIGVAYLPRPAGAPGGVIIGGASLWITDQGSADQQQGAWEFVKFAAQPDSQAFFASNTGYYPMRKAAYTQPLMQTALGKYPQFQVAVNQLHATAQSPPTAGAVFGTFAGTRVLVEGAMEDFLLGKVATAQAALDAAARKANDALAAAPWLGGAFRASLKSPDLR